MQSKTASVVEYLSELEPEGRKALSAVRAVILRNLDKNFEEGMLYGMIGYFVPHRLFPAGYHCDPKKPVIFAGLASQKHYMALYLTCVYGKEDHAQWFREAWTKTGKKLDMGKSCVRFKQLEDVPLDVVAKAIRRVTAKAFIAGYQKGLAERGRGTNRK